MNTRDTDKRLRDLFDRQKKVNEPHLTRLIGETEVRWGAPLTDDELEAVAAAGDPDVGRGKSPWGENR